MRRTMVMSDRERESKMFDFDKFFQTVRTVVTRMKYPALQPGKYSAADLVNDIAETLEASDPNSMSAVPVKDMLGVQYDDLTAADVGDALLVSTRSGERFYVFVVRSE